MDPKDLTNILTRHAQWLRCEEGGERANLTGARLAGAILTDAELSGARLAGADLTGAILTRAELRRADLSGARLAGAILTRAILTDADLTGAILTRAELRRADLTGAGLRRAELSGAILTGADLTGAILAGADLTDARLSGTCLDPAAAPNADCAAFERAADGRCIGWRTSRGTCCGNQVYEVGQTYTAPVFSVAETECHPGIYLWPTRAQAEGWGREHDCAEVVEVRAAPEDIHHAGDKWRALKIEVVG
jgi:hypothetical protein